MPFIPVPLAFGEPTLALNEQVSVVEKSDERQFGSLVTDHVAPKNRASGMPGLKHVVETGRTLVVEASSGISRSAPFRPRHCASLL